MNGEPGTYAVSLGQAHMLALFAAFVAALPLEAVVQELDEYEMRAALMEHESPAAKLARIRDREAAAILLDAKRGLNALFAACSAAAGGQTTIRDSRPAPYVPLDPTRGAAIEGQETTHG